MIDGVGLGKRISAFRESFDAPDSREGSKAALVFNVTNQSRIFICEWISKFLQFLRYLKCFS
jgi:hypothetical protein